MQPEILVELTKAIRKLYTLEDSIIHDEKVEARDLRSKQAVLISEVIQSLQELESSVKRESILGTRPKRHSQLIAA
jgi:hypothetical protein